MSKRLEYEYVKDQFSKFGYRLLSKNYKNIDEKLEYECDKGHIHSMNYHNFKGGNRCPSCSTVNNTKHTIDFIKKQIEIDGYRLLSTEYNGNREKLDIECPEGHRYKANYHDFDRGTRCPICSVGIRAEKRSLNYVDVKNYFESQGYKLLTKTYQNIYHKLSVICPEGHTWSVNWANFKNNLCRCAKCPTQVSKAENELYGSIKEKFNDAISGDRSIISPLELDVVVPSKKIAIEYCGIYWHSDSVKKDRNYHLNKLKRCNDAGYRLITIFEDEWEMKKDIVKSVLSSILNINSSKSIYARKCEVREIESKVARKFCEDNHLQGYSESSIRLGAFNENILVAVMTFSKPNISRNIKNNDTGLYELNRFCTDINYRVIGIASKLFKYFIDNYNSKTIYTYSDRRWFDGKLYSILGFIQDHISPPSYWYVKNNGYKRYHRFNFRKSVLSDRLEKFDSNKTEYENMIDNHYRRIWDCGNIKWVYSS